MDMVLMLQVHNVELRNSKKFAILLFFLLLNVVHFQSIGQQYTVVIKDIPPIYKNNTEFVDLMVDADLLRKKANNFYTLYVKFKISSHGTIDTVVVTGTDDDDLKAYFKRKIKETEVFWKPRTINGLPVESKWFRKTIYIGAKQYGETEDEYKKIQYGYPIMEEAYLRELKKFQKESEPNKYLFWETKTMYMLRPLFLKGAVR